MSNLCFQICTSVIALNTVLLTGNLAIAQDNQLSPTSFSDVSDTYWAAPFIQDLSTNNVVGGFPDDTFRPDAPVSRAQFAALVKQALPDSPVRSAVNFTDVPSDHWAASAIRQAYTNGFISGYS